MNSFGIALLALTIRDAHVASAVTLAWIGLLYAIAVE